MKMIIAASLALSIAGFATPSFAQNQRAIGPSYQLAQAGVPSEAKESDAEDREVSVKIDKARSAGKDVTAAENHQKQGETAMRNGDNKAALKHFEQAETALGEN